MPTYVLNQTSPKTIQDITFMPGDPVKTLRYLNLNDYPELKKISDEPMNYNSRKLIFNNITESTPMSQIITLDNRKVIEIVDGDVPCLDGDVVDIRIFMGHTDDQSQFVPYRDLFRFIHISQKIFTGEIYSYWYPLKEEENRNYEDNLIPTSHWPIGYPFFSLAVVDSVISGSITVYLRDIRQILRNMI